MANLRQNSVSDPPASSLVKKSFKVTDTVENTGLGASLPSRTVYLLSTTTEEKDTVQWLEGVRSVPAVQAGATNTGTVKVTIPAWTAAGTYYLLACANRKSRCLTLTWAMIARRQPLRSLSSSPNSWNRM